MAFITSTANDILDKILSNTDFTHPTTIYVSLHTADPAGTGANEVVPGANSYVRQSCAFDAAATKATANTSDLTWSDMPAETVTHVALWDASTVGNVWWEGALSASKTTGAGDTFKILAGDLDVTLT